MKLQTLGNLKPQLHKAKRKSFTRKPDEIVLESPKTNPKVGFWKSKKESNINQIKNLWKANLMSQIDWWKIRFNKILKPFLSFCPLQIKASSRSLCFCMESTSQIIWIFFIFQIKLKLFELKIGENEHCLFYLSWVI